MWEKYKIEILESCVYVYVCMCTIHTYPEDVHFPLLLSEVFQFSNPTFFLLSSALYPHLINVVYYSSRSSTLGERQDCENAQRLFAANTTHKPDPSRPVHRVYTRNAGKKLTGTQIQFLLSYFNLFDYY